ncbi:MAG: TetR/AcrR family transcriptional regulator [Bacteroidota bacterium]
MPRNTKEKIVSASINLFNELGQANVRLQQIADEAGISVGNLAYHFKNKEAIVSRVYEDLFADFSDLLSYYLHSPELKDFDAQLEKYHQFFNRYRFHLADLMSSRYEIGDSLKTWNDYANKLHAQIRMRISFYEGKGYLTQEATSGLYDQLAKNLWRTIFFSVPEANFRGLDLQVEDFKQEVWSQLQPYLTSSTT